MIQMIIISTVSRRVFFRPDTALISIGPRAHGLLSSLQCLGHVRTCQHSHDPKNSEEKLELADPVGHVLSFRHRRFSQLSQLSQLSRLSRLSQLSLCQKKTGEGGPGSEAYILTILDHTSRIWDNWDSSARESSKGNLQKNVAPSFWLVPCNVHWLNLR